MSDILEINLPTPEPGVQISMPMEKMGVAIEPEICFVDNTDEKIEPEICIVDNTQTNDGMICYM